MITKDILDFLTATVVYVQGTLRKKQLKVSFIGHFKKIIKIMFREVLCTLCQLYSASTDCSTKETIDSFFRRTLS